MPSLLDNINAYGAEFDAYIAEQNRRLNNATFEDFVNFGKGSATGLLTAAPDIVGLLGQLLPAQGTLTGRFPGSQNPDPRPPGPSISGDPIRQVAGTDNTAGLLGEFVDPSSAAVKGVGLLGDLARHAPDIKGGLLGAMTLFHGTPHKFDRFSLDAIGTGEGAQAFGHGLYFAENKGVAQSYKDKLSDVRSDPTAEEWIKIYGSKEKAIEQAKIAREKTLGQFFNEPVPPGSDRFSEIQEIRSKFGDDALNNMVKDPKRLIEEQEVWDTTIKAIDDYNPGSLYEVEIPDEITDRMLDWDAPLSEQPDAVKKAFSDAAHANPQDMNANTAFAGTANITDTLAKKDGNALYRDLSKSLGGDEAASQYLNELGIPGIRFFDGNSRSAGEGTRNIVVFNPDDITSVKRDGELVWENATGIANE